MIGRTVSLVPECVPEDDEFDPIADDFCSKERSYIHFDLPLSKSERENFEISKPELAAHDFWPLLGFVKSERRIKFDEDRNHYFESKPREIKFGSHRDAAILEYYGQVLTAPYEALIEKMGLASSVLAYRAGVGSNIHHANSLFAEISERGDCIAIGMDVSKFFDRIDHRTLLAALKKVLEVSHLPDADYHVFRMMTKFAWVDVVDLQRKLGRSKPIGGRLCSPREFRTLVREKADNVVRTNNQKFGIPQGTPLSGLFANIAMLEFDRLMTAYLRKRGGSYRRYSDDIAIVLPSDGHLGNVLKHVERTLKKFGLNLNKAKTDTVHFKRMSGVQSASKPFQYLGFTFDGRRKLIRSSSIGRYYEKMRRGIRAKVHAAKEKKIPPDRIFLRELFTRYTHFGKYRNFPQYAYRAARIMGAPEIRRQLKSHMRHFKRHLRDALVRVYGGP